MIWPIVKLPVLGIHNADTGHWAWLAFAHANRKGGWPDPTRPPARLSRAWMAGRDWHPRTHNPLTRVPRQYTRPNGAVWWLW